MTSNGLPPSSHRSPNAQQRRGAWRRTLHRWHWISAALCLVGMLLFAITGMMLNHASQIESQPVTTHRSATLPPALVRALGTRTKGDAPLPTAVANWIESKLDIRVDRRSGEWSAAEIYLALPRPGGDAWLSVDRTTGAIAYEQTERGWIAYLNDLHKGRHTGPAWGWFLDLFAMACLVFCITGLFLLQLHASHRHMTWPLTGLGLLIPLLIAVLLIH